MTQNARFINYGITPTRVGIPVDSTTKVVTKSGTIESTSDKNYVIITLTYPDGKEEPQSPAFYVKTATHNIKEFEWKFGVNKDTKIGEYKVKCVLNENKNEFRVGTFVVTK